MDPQIVFHDVAGLFMIVLAMLLLLLELKLLGRLFVPAADDEPAGFVGVAAPTPV